MADEKAVAGGQAWVKWVVFGALALAFMILFKAEIGQFLGRAEKLQVGPGGVEILTTPLGQTLVTNVSQGEVPSNAQVPGLPKPDGGQLQSYDGGAFVLSWPSNGDWRLDAASAAQLAYAGITLVLRYRDLVNGFNPNINVSVESVGDLSYEDWLAAGNLTFEAMGAQVLESKSDPVSQGAVRVVQSANGLYQIQRVLIRDGLAYVVTASTRHAGSDDVSQQMLAILNSFRLK